MDTDPAPTSTEDTRVALAAVATLLRYLGDDPARPGLADTPVRVLRALTELAGGRVAPAPGLHLLTQFPEPDVDQMVVLGGISFTSMCEHHLLPFQGTATVGYLPRGHVVGISKLARLVTGYAARLQTQERLTTQIAQSIAAYLSPDAAATLTAHHLCMGCRGVRQPATTLVTSCLLGAFLEDGRTRAEFLAHADVR